jgi:hypothetical protein
MQGTNDLSNLQTGPEVKGEVNPPLSVTSYKGRFAWLVYTLPGSLFSAITSA